MNKDNAMNWTGVWVVGQRNLELGSTYTGQSVIDFRLSD
jgi:hypothetical protein